MKPVKRFGVNKGRSASRFRGQIKRTKAANISSPRGGYRL